MGGKALEAMGLVVFTTRTLCFFPLLHKLTNTTWIKTRAESAVTFTVFTVVCATTKKMNENIVFNSPSVRDFNKSNKDDKRGFTLLSVTAAYNCFHHWSHQYVVVSDHPDGLWTRDRRSLVRLCCGATQLLWQTTTHNNSPSFFSKSSSPDVSAHSSLCPPDVCSPTTTLNSVNVAQQKHQWSEKYVVTYYRPKIHNVIKIKWDIWV